MICLIFRIQLFLILLGLSYLANSQALPDSALNFETGKWWTDTDVEKMKLGDLSGVLNQFDMIHTGFLRETDLFRKYNNYYLGNGRLGMFVDALGAQSLPYSIDSINLSYPEFNDREGIDVTIGKHKSEELLSETFHYGRNQQPTINYNESWVKTKWTEHNNLYGRGHLSIRNSIFPTLNNLFEANSSNITNYRQRLKLWDNCCITEFTYKQQLLVQITSYTHWSNNRVAVFHYQIKNISNKNVDAGCVAEPFVSFHGQKFPFNKEKEGLILHLKMDSLLFELSIYMGASGINISQTNQSDKIVINSHLNPGDSSSFTIYQAIVTSKNVKNPVETSYNEVNSLAGKNYSQVFEEHCNSVHKFWQSSFVLLPWKDLCKLYYRSALIIAGNLRYGDYYPCVSMLTNSSYTGFGWGMDNVPIYDFLMQTGRADYVVNVFKHFSNTMPADSGNYGNQLNYSFGPNPWSTMVCNSSGNYAYLMYQYYSITGDTSFFNHVLYPQLKSFCNFWSGFANNAGGSYGFWTREKYNNKQWEVHTYDEMVYKYGKNYNWGESDHVFDVVAPAKWTLETTVALAKERKLDPDLRIQWENCNTRLALPQSDSFFLTYRNRSDTLVYKPDPFPERKVSACAQFNCIYPTFLNNINKEKVTRTYNIIRQKDILDWNFNYNLQIYDIAARLNMPEELEWLLTRSKANIRDRLDAAEHNTFSESGQSDGAGYFLMPYGMLNVSINEMLLQSYNDTLQVFPCIMPMFVQYPLLFYKLRAENGFIVSASWNKGETENVEIQSLNGNRCILKIPRKWKYISVLSGNKKIAAKTDRLNGIISFATLAGRTYTIIDRKSLHLP